jgi:hypothetical protein
MNIEPGEWRCLDGGDCHGGHEQSAARNEKRHFVRGKRAFQVEVYVLKLKLKLVDINAGD